MSILVNLSFNELHAYISKRVYYVYHDNYYNEFIRVSNDTVIYIYYKHNFSRYTKKIKLKKHYRLEIQYNNKIHLWYAYSKSALKRKINKFKYQHNIK